MTRKRVKIVALCIAALVTLAAQAIAAPNKPISSSAQNTRILFAKDPNFSFGSDQQFDTGNIYWKMMFAIMLVLALGIVLYYVSKKVGGKIVNLSGRNIHLVETLYLGSRKALHLIKVGDKNILVGTTPTTITKIADLGTDSSTVDNQTQ